jgi:uncharacterized protein (TIGR02145 family)
MMNSKTIFFISALVLSLASCTKDEEIKPLATISTADVTNLDVFTATIGGSVTSDGGFLITQRGMCWSTTTNPTISDNKTSDGEGVGSLASTITGLQPKTRYYARAYATNSNGTAYGGIVSFTTLDGAKDIDGNVYHVVTIGTQVWMVENLKTTKYNDGLSIPNVTGVSEWGSLTTPSYCWLNNNASANKNTYVALYNWYAINTGKLCPTGWHIPSDAEWTAMELYLQANGYNYDGIIDTDNNRTTNNNTAKSLGATTGWASSSFVGVIGNTDYPAFRNKTGFTAMPGGHRYINGLYYNNNGDGFWWSSTEISNTGAWGRYLLWDDPGMYRNQFTKTNGFSVRCVKN